MRLDGVAKAAGALLAGVAMLAAAAADAAPGVVTQNLNLRAGPGIDYPLVAQLPAGTPTEIFGCLQGYGWCDVAIQGARGWAAGPGLQLLYDDQPEPVVGYGAVVGVPLIGFDVDSYWGHYYRGRPWYRDVGRYHGGGPHGGPPGGFRGQPGVAHPVGPAAFVGHPPELGRGPEPGRVPGVITPHEAVRASEPGPRPGPPAARPGPEPARVQAGPRPGPGPQGPAPGGHPGPGRPAEPHGGREPPPR